MRTLFSGRLLAGPLVAGALVAALPRARAEPPPDGESASDPARAGETIVIHGRAPACGVEALDSADTQACSAGQALREPGSVTVIRAEEHEGETTSTAEVLARSVGVNVRSLGGLGSYAALSIRGAAPAQTVVAVDGVPLSRIASGVADVSLFELDSFARVEVHRGSVPVELGGAAMGGAVNFVTATGRGPSGHRGLVSLGGGSYGTYHVRGRWGDSALRDGHLSYHVAAGLRGTAGDYPYFNDNGTPLNLDDDAQVIRSNNGYVQWDATGRVRYRRSDVTVEGGARALYKDRGVPGVGSVQSVEASLGTLGVLADVRVTRAVAGRELGLGAYAMVETERFRDLLGEVGLGIQDSRGRIRVAGASAQSTHAWARHAVTLAAEGRVDDMQLRDSTRGADIHGYRLGGAVSLRDVVTPGRDSRWALVPGVRVDALHTAPGTGWNPVIVDVDALATRSDVAVSPRLATRVLVHPAVSLKAGAGRYVRVPTLVELFGNQGYLVGNPGLRAETGWSADLGVVAAPGAGAGMLDRVYLEAAAFLSRPRDAIAFVPTAGKVAVAANLDDAVIAGVEATATARLWRRATVATNYTLIHSRQTSRVISYDGKRLPHRPVHQLYARADIAGRVRGRLGVVWVDATYASGSFLDAANLLPVPRRLFFGAGLKLAPVSGLLLAVEVKNATDRRVEQVSLVPPPSPDLLRIPQPVADFLGYPLPGRAVYLRLDWRF